ncbi:hypothetical protein AA11237_3637 [Acidocella aminolytica 101 = DSM 11237]|nr:hypothetical protein AA11237_3637 [Acidocella aminolytica 101 = DSM 11237]
MTEGLGSWSGARGITVNFVESGPIVTETSVRCSGYGKVGRIPSVSYFRRPRGRRPAALVKKMRLAANGRYRPYRQVTTQPRHKANVRYPLS